MKDNPSTKSPIKDPPLRVAGQSLREEIHDLAYGRLLAGWIAIVMVLVMAGMEWVQWTLRMPPMPLLGTCVAIVAVGIICWWLRGSIRQLRQLLLGYKGELAVGQALEQTRTKGYQVFHDILQEGFNIDHAIVGPAGVFCIETKTRRKPARGQSKVIFDGEQITVDGHTPDRDPANQTKALARRLSGLVREIVGKDVFVQPVVLYVGWWVDPPIRPELWVCNETAFPKLLDHEPVRLTPEEVQRIASGLTIYLRERERQR
ncbi:MAG: nuclease-related domain-containing protein [Planctomycetota bacterium]|nr:nuclease-related domain-containing protein [Planctomycetota bacterium]